MAEKTYDGIKARSSVSGLPEAEVNGLWEKVRENHARLTKCQGVHKFEAIEKTGGGLGVRFRCTKCGGDVNRDSLYWYAIGVAAALCQPAPMLAAEALLMLSRIPDNG